jgi:hypothetical protein
MTSVDAPFVDLGLRTPPATLEPEGSDNVGVLRTDRAATLNLAWRQDEGRVFMRMPRSIIGFVTASSMAFALMAPAAIAAEVDLRTRLQGSATFTKATGFSEYDRSSHDREIEVTVRNIGGLAGRNVVVFVHGMKVGAVRVSSAGVAHREWDTERGQSVPVASAGDVVSIRTVGGTLVASGKYVHEAND